VRTAAERQMHLRFPCDVEPLGFPAEPGRIRARSDNNSISVRATGALGEDILTLAFEHQL
jgi:hypothetical protein